MGYKSVAKCVLWLLSTMSVLSLSSSFLRELQRNKSLYAILLLGLTAYSVVRYIRSPYRKLPPGPKGYPIIGNFLNIGEKQWHVFTEWKKVYGETIVLFRCCPDAEILSRRLCVFQGSWPADACFEYSEGSSRSS